MYEVDEIKVYVFYLKGHKDVYCFTASKKIRDMFLEQRNKKCFDIDKVIMDEFEFGLFGNTNKNKMIEEFPMDLGDDKYLLMLTTQEEQNKLEAIWNSMEHDMEDIYHTFRRYKDYFKDEYIEAIEFLTDTRRYKRNQDSTSDYLTNLNTIALFSRIFKETFDEKEDE